jgi:hypothetical protein
MPAVLLAADAGAGGEACVEGPRAELIPAHVVSFAATEAAGIELTPANELAAWRASLEIDAKPNFGMLVDDEPGSSGSAGRYLPVLYSLLIPGTGEISMGYTKRGIALVALEVIAWTGYAYYRNEGLDGRAEFEAFADAHWDHDRWIMDHPAVEGWPDNLKTFELVDSIGQNAWSGWPGYHSYAAKDDVKLNYYENIGKYDWFISGWEDWDPLTKPMNTALRDQYRTLRRESNSDLDKADRFIYLSVVTRVFSLVETAYLAHRRGRDSDSGTANKRNYSITTRSTGIASGEVAFEYRF